MAARVRTLPAAVAPVLVGTSLALGDGPLPRAGLRRRAARGAVHPGGHEPLKRLLRRPPGGRHGGPPGPGPGDRGRARPAEPGADRDLRHVRPGGACGVYLIAVAGWVLLAIGAASILAGVLYTGGPPPVRLRGPRGAVRVPLLRHRRRRRLLLRAGPAAPLGGVRLRDPRRAARERDPRRQQRPRSSRPTAARASARSR